MQSSALENSDQSANQIETTAIIQLKVDDKL